jgi:hypothetical protein
MDLKLLFFVAVFSRCCCSEVAALLCVLSMLHPQPHTACMLIKFQAKPPRNPALLKQ